MIVNLDIPELEKYTNGFGGYWLGLMFMNNAPTEYVPRALTTSYVRLVEGALRSYSSGRQHVDYFWNRRDPASLPLEVMQQAILDYETCLTCLHRAIRVHKALQKSPLAPMEFKRDILTKSKFEMGGKVADRIRFMRDATQHVDAFLIKEKIPRNTWFSLNADGPEIPHPTEVGQTIKTIDRLVLGDQMILFTELHDWLMEFGRYAEAISTYNFTPASAP